MDSNILPEGQIDGHRVVFYRGIGWRRDCETFPLRGAWSLSAAHQNELIIGQLCAIDSDCTGI